MTSVRNGFAVRVNGSYRTVTEEMELQEGETFYYELPQWAIDLVAYNDADWNSSLTLGLLTKQANAQVSALAGRITTLEWLINDQDPDDPEYVEPLPEEVIELPIRRTQFTKWNSYNVKLGRVKLQAGWPFTPVWPAIPEPYNNDTSSRSSSEV